MPKTQTEYQRPMQHHQIYQHVHNGVTEGGEKGGSKNMSTNNGQEYAQFDEEQSKNPTNPNGEIQKIPSLDIP